MSSGSSIPVIGLAHGSRHPRGREAIEALMRAVSAQGGMPARAAYLDLAEPDLETVVGELAAAGHRAAYVVPLLFTAAFHATVDVPDAVRAAAAAVGLELRVTRILGTGTDVAELVADALVSAGVEPQTSVLVFAVGSSDPAANASVVDLGTDLGRGRPGAVRVGFGTCAPRGLEVADELAGPVAVAPLFLADGLLLDPIRRRAAERGWVCTEPLGERAAGLVLRRCAAAETVADLR